MWFGTDNNTGYMTEIVGMVGDVRSLRLDRKNDVEFYRPWAQRSNAFHGGDSPHRDQTRGGRRNGAKRAEQTRSRPSDHSAQHDE